jgi:hypothetical protein
MAHLLPYTHTQTYHGAPAAHLLSKNKHRELPTATDLPHKKKQPTKNNSS